MKGKKKNNQKKGECYIKELGFSLVTVRKELDPWQTEKKHEVGKKTVEKKKKGAFGPKRNPSDVSGKKRSDEF